MIQVDEAGDNEGREERPVHKAHGDHPEPPDDEAIPGGVEGLYERVAPPDAGPAAPAPAAQPEVAEDRNVVIPDDGCLALRALRSRPHDGSAKGQAMDADIQKAADDGTDEHRDRHMPLGTHPASADSSRTRPSARPLYVNSLKGTRPRTGP